MYSAAEDAEEPPLRELLLQLPKEIVFNEIMPRVLPLAEIARLSNSVFRGLWTRLPHLIIDEEILIGTKLSRYVRKHTKLSYALEIVIENIFSHHKGNLDTLSLDFSKFSSLGRLDENKLSKWIQESAKKHIKFLTIHDCISDPAEIKLPLTVFLCKELKILKLGLCDLSCMNDGCSEMPCLLECHLHNVSVTGKGLEMLVKCCCNLEDLRIYNPASLNTIRIESSSLKHFHLDGRLNMAFATPHVRMDCPLLVSLTIRLDLCVSAATKEVSVDVFAPRCRSLVTNCSLLDGFLGLDQLETLCIFRNSFCTTIPLQILENFPRIERVLFPCVDVKSTKFSSPFGYLKYLRIHIYHYGAEELAVLGGVIRFCPSLVTLIIDFSPCMIQMPCAFCCRIIGKAQFKSHISELERANPNLTISFSESR